MRGLRFEPSPHSVTDLILRASSGDGANHLISSWPRGREKERDYFGPCSRESCVKALLVLPVCTPSPRRSLLRGDAAQAARRGAVPGASQAERGRDAAGDTDPARAPASPTLAHASGLILFPRCREFLLAHEGATAGLRVQIPAPSPASEPQIPRTPLPAASVVWRATVREPRSSGKSQNSLHTDIF